MLGRILILLFITLLGCKSITENKFKEDSLPENPNEFIVNDYSELLSDVEEKELVEVLYNYEVETTRQIVILTVDSIKPFKDIRKFASDIGNKWGIGQQETDNGLIIVLSSKLKNVGIATGLGTEKALTDQFCKKTIDSIMTPHFKDNNYFLGLKEGVNSLIQEWNLNPN